MGWGLRRRKPAGRAGVAGPLAALLVVAGSARAEEAPPTPQAAPQIAPQGSSQGAPQAASQAVPAQPSLPAAPSARREPARPGQGTAPAVAGEPAPVPAGPAAPVQGSAPPAARTPAARGAPAVAAKPPQAPAPLKVAAVSGDPRPTLAPETFIATARAADAYLRIAENGGWPTLPARAPLKLGDRGSAVALLRRRLAATGDLPPDMEAGDLFDAGVAAGVKRFQARHGLPETGLVAARTLAALNVPAAERYRQLTASANRLLGSNFAFGERYVVVNIPAATVEAVEGGQVARRYVAVVGKKDRASPRVETRITNVNFNPTWTVPVSLIRKDIIPHMRKDPAYLAKHRIRILDGQGREVEPAAIDWSTERAVNYTLRQDPHDGNSLGQVRIDMPNRQAVYMHDTPTKRLFALDARFHSSGCVRVADVRAFVEWLLQGAAPQTVRDVAQGIAQGTHQGAGQAAPVQPGPGPAPATTFGGGGWTPGEIEAAIASGRRIDVKLAKPVPVAWVYLTGYATADGTAHFRDDVYGLDAEGGALPPPDDAQTSALPQRAALPPRRP